MSKKYFSLLLSIVLLTLATTPAFAAIKAPANIDSNLVVVTKKTQAEIDAELEQQMQEQVNKAMQSLSSENAIAPRVGGAEWKTTRGAKKTVTVGGFAGNQVSGGYRFSTGGGFYFSDSGGPTVSATVTFGAPYASVGLSIALGNKSGSGVLVTVPDKTSYWKLYISKTVQVEPWVIYTRPTSSSPWRVWSRGSNSVVTKVDHYAKKV